MRRAEKESFVSDFSERIEKAQMFALMSFHKLTVEQMTNFRLSLRKKGVRVKVVKNTLAKRSFEKTPYAKVCESLDGPTLVVYGNDDPIVMTKAVWEWVTNPAFEVDVKGGVALGSVMNKSQLEALSKLPGRSELLTSFLWALKSAPTKFLYALQDAPRKLGYALAALQKKKESGQ